MSEQHGSHNVAKKATLWGALIFAVGIIADFGGAFGFLTGMDVPKMWHHVTGTASTPHPAATAVATRSPTSAPPGKRAKKPSGRRSHGTESPQGTGARVVAPSPRAEPQYLSDEGAADTNAGGVGSGEATVDGRDFPRSVWLCSDLESIANINCTDTPTPEWADFNVPAGYRTLKATVGFSSGSRSNCGATTSILVGAKSLYSRTFYYGASLPLQEAVPSGGRVRFEILPKKLPGAQDKCTVVLGDARFTS